MSQPGRSGMIAESPKASWVIVIALEGVQEGGGRRGGSLKGGGAECSGILVSLLFILSQILGALER